MNLNKIDKNLHVMSLELNQKRPCVIYCKNFDEVFSEIKNLDIHIERDYKFINSIFCLATQKEIFQLSDFCDVDFIFSLSNVNSLMYVSKKILEVEKTNLFGQDVGVAFIDTGIATHCDFVIGRNRIIEFKDFISNKKIPYDDNGHGTFVCGVCSGNGAMSGFRYSGIAPRSNIFALKALNGQGEASANKILDAMEWVYDNHFVKNIKVVCMSFGSEPLGANDPIMLGADALWRDGVVVVAAAGNSGPEFQTIKSPGISPKVITVGGIDDNRYDNKSFNRQYFEIAEFSSRGPAFRTVKPDVVAPSVDIISCGINRAYTTLSGTSVATPMIAGLACLILEKNPNFVPNQVKREIQRISQPLGFEMNLEGYGVPNLRKLC